MSCRVLGRRVQEAALAHLASAAASEGATRLVGQYRTVGSKQNGRGSLSIAGLRSCRHSVRRGERMASRVWWTMRRRSFRSGSKTASCHAPRSTLERRRRAQPFRGSEDFALTCCLIRSFLSSRSCRFRFYLPMAPGLGVRGPPRSLCSACRSPSTLVAPLPIAASHHFHCVQLRRRRVDAAGPRRGSTRQIRVILTLGVLADVMFLGWFKYANFVVDNVNWVAASQIPLDRIALPLAISFFTFQKIAYLIDTARGETRPVGILDFSVFAAFYPRADRRPDRPLHGGDAAVAEAAVRQARLRKILWSAWSFSRSGCSRKRSSPTPWPFMSTLFTRQSGKATD